MKSTLNLAVSVFCATLLGSSAMATDSPAGAVDPRSYGAKADGMTLDTAALQKAIDVCGNLGGGLVLLTRGTYLSQPLHLRSRVTLKLESGAVLKATDDPADFAGGKAGGFIPFLDGSGLDYVTLAGPGTIDGSGAKWWEPAEQARRKTPGYTLPRPNLIVLTRCRNLLVRDITLQNSPKFHLVPTECEDVLVTNVTILAPAGSPNTDAIDPSACCRVLITRCHIDVGDDNVAIKAGRKVAEREFSCEDITVTDCTFLHGHGVSIGSETSGGVHKVVVRNCTFEGTENGLRIKSQRGKGGLVENITYTDIRMTNVNPAITFTCYYMNNSQGDPVQPVVPDKDTAQALKSGTPHYRNILIRNITATCPKLAGTILGLPESPIEGLVLENVRITSETGIKIRNARNINFKKVTLDVHHGDPLLLENAEVQQTRE